MLFKKLIPFIVLALLFSCSNQVTKSEDYSQYLITVIDDNALMADAQFWTNKLEAVPNQFPYYAKRASAYTKIFSTTGNIDFLIKAEKDLIKANHLTNYKKAAYLKSLASNYISQHRFKAALELLKQAEAIGEKLIGTKKMLFDVHLELGNSISAESYLKAIKNNSDFDYLIRLAKWEDNKGNLDKAIVCMEMATAIAESSNIKATKQWAYTNLADFYGHAGHIDKSYSYYLKALALDPNDAYAKKGIAWILYSHENNTEKALELLNHITSYYNAPDYSLLKAEIAASMNNEQLKSQAIDTYNTAVKNVHYGDMYNKYNVLLYTEDLELTAQALEIAKREVENRPTAESYDLLAWSYFKNGNLLKANEIVETYVEGSTSEPDVLYHIAEIYKAVGKTEKVKPLKKELIASLYELGPLMASKIKQL